MFEFSDFLLTVLSALIYFSPLIVSWIATYFQVVMTPTLPSKLTLLERLSSDSSDGSTTVQVTPGIRVKCKPAEPEHANLSAVHEPNLRFDKHAPRFYVDSGATAHMCNDLFVMRNPKSVKLAIRTGSANGIIEGSHVGTVILNTNPQYLNTVNSNLLYFKIQYMLLNSDIISFPLRLLKDLALRLFLRKESALYRMIRKELWPELGRITQDSTELTLRSQIQRCLSI